jgi:hypothetical protein
MSSGQWIVFIIGVGIAGGSRTGTGLWPGSGGSSTGGGTSGSGGTGGGGCGGSGGVW